MSKKSPVFRLNGKPFDPQPLPTPVRKAIALLESMPDGDLFTMKELAAKLGYTPNTFETNASTHPALDSYRVLVKFPSRQCVYGHPQTIKDLSTHKEILA